MIMFHSMTDEPKQTNQTCIKLQSRIQNAKQSRKKRIHHRQSILGNNMYILFTGQKMANQSMKKTRYQLRNSSTFYSEVSLCMWRSVLEKTHIHCRSASQVPIVAVPHLTRMPSHQIANNQHQFVKEKIFDSSCVNVT